MTLSFTRNKVVAVEPLADDALSVSWRLVDSLLHAEIVMKVRVPDLEIVEVDARISRSPHDTCAAAPELVKKVVE